MSPFFQLTGERVVNVHYRDRRGKMGVDDHAMLCIFNAEREFHARGISNDDKSALQRAAMGADDRRVVYVQEMDTGAVDRCMRVIHATVAFLASTGLVSGESLVAFRAKSAATSATSDALRPLGSLLVCRARDLRSTDLRKLRKRLSFLSRRGAEIGQLYTA